MDSAAVRHKEALTSMKERNAPKVTFTEYEATYDETTDRNTDSVPVSVAGYAVQLSNDPTTFRELSLIESEAVTLLFVPNSIGGKPQMNSQVTWAGEVRTVKDVKPIRPNGQVIAAKVIAA